MKKQMHTPALLFALTIICGCMALIAFPSNDSAADEKAGLAANEYEAAAGIGADPERLQNESAANDQYNRLLAGLREEAGTYPAYYAGAYIDGNGHLVVCVADGLADADAMEAIRTFTGNPDIEIETVELSYRDLLDAQNEISESLSIARPQSDEDSVFAAINGIYVDEERNRVVVMVQDLNDEKIAEFRAAFPQMYFVEFEEGYTASDT